ncbi:ankyrin repeat domain-containing protein [Rickettsiella massiliensis]|uniref:ankyrin repeat domain-containing protein n=1 Tax=Rickettsiella massiliensis TaxID=676517 RepID=UPI000A057570
MHPRSGWGVLHHAVAAGQDKTVLATLIEQGAEVDLKDGKGNTVLHYLAKSTCYSDDAKKILQNF